MTPYTKILPTPVYPLQWNAVGQWKDLGLVQNESQQNFTVKKTHSKKLFFVKFTCTYTLQQSPTVQNLFGAIFFFYSTILKPTATPFQNTLTFDQYLFNSRRTFSCELSPLEFTSPKRGHITYLFRTNIMFPWSKSQNKM